MALVGAAVIAGAPLACVGGPGREDVALQRLTTRMCEKARECGCDEPPSEETTGAGAAECGGWPPLDLDAEHYGSEHASRAFDPACAERWASWVDTVSCEAPTLPSYADLCPLYHGTRRAGETCSGASLVETECERGAYCLAGVCRDLSRSAFGTAGEPCDLGSLCDEGLECIDAVCQRLPGAGEPCLAGYLCDDDSSCYETFCASRPGVGEPCSFDECGPGGYCGVDPVDGVSECRPAGDVGDRCMGHRQCSSGNCPAGFCEEPAGVGDPCGGQLPCGPGLRCDAGQCRPAGDGVTAGSVCTLLAF